MRSSDAGIISRRGCVGGLAAALIVGTAVTRAGQVDAVAPAEFHGLIRHRASAARIGRRYLATLPSTPDRSRLLEMSPALGRILQATSRSRALAADLLRTTIADDFRRADTVVVDGWVLSATEARLCAVIALS